MNFYLLTGRHGERILTRANKSSWDYLVSLLEDINGVTMEELGEEVEGSFATGWLYIDDGGKIETIELTEV